MAFMYDGRGNLTGMTDGADVTTYTWDARDRLSGVGRLISVANPLGHPTSYGYDPASNTRRHDHQSRLQPGGSP